MQTQFIRNWTRLKEFYKFDKLPEALLECSFLMNLDDGLVYPSPALAHALGRGDDIIENGIPASECSRLLPPENLEQAEHNIRRLFEGKLMRTDLRIEFILQEDTLPALCIIAKIPDTPLLLGLVHLCYDLMHEYKSNLDCVVEKLKESQVVNQLILEGSTDYIYQLDLVKNVCTFSPKALDVLPLESPTFGNAMDRVLSFIVPEDRHIFLDSFVPFLTGQSQYHTAEYRVNTKQGDIMWISCHGKGIHDEQGRPRIIAGSLMDVTEIKKAEDQMMKLVYTDILTGLKNRHCYEKELASYMEKTDASGSILCIDIRDFKLYNEIFGHNFGNKILREFAEVLDMYFPTKLGIYRLEGDEFLIHLAESDKDAILAALSPLQLALAKPRLIDGHSIYINITIGIAVYPEHGSSPDELLKNADTVLYKMSKYSNEKVMFYISENGKDLSKRYNLENELRADIDAGFRHFRMVYQPIVRIEHDGRAFWCSAEALLRYNNPALPDVSQKDLIETLEVSDLIIPVGRWVLSQAIGQCSNWHRTGARATVHVNISAQQISDAGILEHIKYTLEKNRLPARYLICELTETSLIHNFDTANRFCLDLMEMGIGIALDDFGTGYTSFNYLRDLPISQIKIDKAYVRSLCANEYNQIIIRCLYDLSKSMKLELCIEGVETKDTLELLSAMGVTLIQGFYFERPMEAEIIAKEFLQHCLPFGAHA